MRTSTVLMVRPQGFGFNEQTALDNAFQTKPEEGAAEQVRLRALSEFENMVCQLKDLGVDVLVLEPNEHSDKTPDAIFPNNWLVSDFNNRLFVYPMKTPNRKLEARPNDVKALLEKNHFEVNEVVDIQSKFNSSQIVEGTGVLGFDHDNRLAYAALSERCEFDLTQSICDWLGYQLVSFETKSSCGLPVYHTNVVMSVGKDFVVACLDCIQQPQKFAEVVHKSGKELIKISLKQMEKGMCGNVIELASENGERILLASSTAWRNFSKQQRAWFKERLQVCHPDISTIEEIGGGSCRCMVAEIFNQRPSTDPS